MDSRTSNAYAGLFDLLKEHVPQHTALWIEVVDDPSFQKWPASLHKHHTFEGGLMAHTLEVASMALHALSSFPVKEPFRVEVLLLGALFHDFGKLRDYEPNVQLGGYIPCNLPWRKTKHYDLIHHVVAGASMFTSMACDAGLDPLLIEAVEHVILSHHGRLEWGSPVTPKTREAWAVHCADMMSVFAIERRWERTD